MTLHYSHIVIIYRSCVCLQPSQFENIVNEAVTLVKETVVQPGLRESPLLNNAVAKKELTASVQAILHNFVQVSDYFVYLDVNSTCLLYTSRCV